MSNMKCRNEKCIKHCNDSSNCTIRDIFNLSGCGIYIKLLPLWEFQDKWKGLKNGNDYGIECEKKGYYFGWINYSGESYMGCKWSSIGVCVNNSSTLNLIPKEPEFYDGWIDGDGILYTHGMSKGWKPVKLQVVKN